MISIPSSPPSSALLSSYLRVFGVCVMNECHNILCCREIKPPPPSLPHTTHTHTHTHTPHTVHLTPTGLTIDRQCLHSKVLPIRSPPSTSIPIQPTDTLLGVYKHHKNLCTYYTGRTTHTHYNITYIAHAHLHINVLRSCVGDINV